MHNLNHDHKQTYKRANTNIRNLKTELSGHERRPMDEKYLLLNVDLEIPNKTGTAIKQSREWHCEVSCKSMYPNQTQQRKLENIWWKLLLIYKLIVIVTNFGLFQFSYSKYFFHLFRTITNMRFSTNFLYGRLIKP